MAMLQRLRQRCPTLFQNLLPQNEQHQVQPSSAHIDQDDVLDSLISDSLHSDITAMIRPQNKYYCKMLMLPTRGAEAITAFPTSCHTAAILRMALAHDYCHGYNMPNIFQLGSKFFRWWEHMCELQLGVSLITIPLLIMCFTYPPSGNALLSVSTISCDTAKDSSGTSRMIL